MPPTKAAPRVPGAIRATNGHSVNGHLDGAFADQSALLATFREVLMDEGARVLGAVSRGDLSQRVPLELNGEPLRGDFLRWANVVNAMVVHLGACSSEVTRVAQEVGTEGKLGGQATVPGVAGTWRDLTDSVNLLAANLTKQVRGIAEVTTAVANGDLSKKIVIRADGEIGSLSETINGMIGTLATLADQITRVAREVGIDGKLGGQAFVPGATGLWRDLTDNVNLLAANLTSQVRAIGTVSTAVTNGDMSQFISVDANGEIGQLKDNINQMIVKLRDTTQQNTEQDWLKTSLAMVTGRLQGQKDLQTVGDLILSGLAPLVNVQHGVLYVNRPDDGRPLLKLLSAYAYQERKGLSQQFRLGEGLVGQCAYEKQRILLTGAPADYVQISSGLGAAPPINIVVLPVLFEGDIRAVLELASFSRFSETHLSFLDQLMQSIGVVMNTITTTVRTEELLLESQALSVERQQTNDELVHKAKLLADQNEEVERQRIDMNAALAALELKAEQLALTTKYKSQFLANMSHELRTPLNSMLILSEQLTENREQNLTPKQVEFAATILGASNDLLTMINDILDLSKIESGTISADVGEVSFADVEADVRQTFGPVAKNKDLGFVITLSPTLPRTLYTDSARLQQVLKNLLSNAFKFTQKGSVDMAVDVVSGGWSADRVTLNRAESVVAFAVSDTGIGIRPDKQAVIFEAFQQADMTTSRRFGGTGLGLSISRELASLLGGEIHVTSELDRGSVFTLYLPLRYHPPQDGTAAVRAAPPRSPASAPTRNYPTPAAPEAISRPPTRDQAPDAIEVVAPAEPTVVRIEPVDAVADDRASIRPGDKVLLIVDDDVRFTRTIVDAAHGRGFKALVALRGSTALSLARQFSVDAVTLDIELPDMDGWKVLDALKHDPKSRHIPVHVISVEDYPQRALELGAVAVLTKPVTKKSLAEAFDTLDSYVNRPVKNLLVVQSEERSRKMIVDLIGEGDVATTIVETGAAALAELEKKKFDCMVLDLALPDMTGFQLIDAIKLSARTPVPIVVYSNKRYSAKDETRLRELAETVVVKDARSPERLLDETALFLHRADASLPEAKRKLLQEVHRTSPSLKGKKVLIVDDDVRNIFALTSALERHEMQLLNAEGGETGIDILLQNPDVDAVLMDIMMPEMDGLETIRRIRENPRYKALPIIAVTAKAMKSDRELCLNAGASDYVSKPIDIEYLVSLLRVWLHK